MLFASWCPTPLGQLVRPGEPPIRTVCEMDTNGAGRGIFLAPRRSACCPPRNQRLAIASNWPESDMATSGQLGTILVVVTTRIASLVTGSSAATTS